MFRLIETIHIKKGQILNLSYHNNRLNLSRKILYSCTQDLKLENYIYPPIALSNESIKCRVLFNEKIERIEFLRYHAKSINSLLIVEDDNINYHHKFEERSSLTTLYNKRGHYDDILIVKNGLITDTYYCNVAFLKDGQWFTPKTPLLKGTKRESLIHLGSVITADIRSDELDNYQAIRLFNSMLAFGQIELPIKAIKIVE